MTSRHHSRSRPMASSMSTSAWMATTSNMARTAPPTRLRPWQPGWRAICRGVFHQQVAIGVVRQPAASDEPDDGDPPMGEVVDLHSQPAHLEDDELIENLARFADGTLSEAAVKARHHLSNEDWAALGESDRLVELVEAAKLRRIRTGATKRERAQIEIVDGPPILGKIMRDPNANERHGSIQSKHSMRWPAPAPKPRQPGLALK